MTLGTTVLVRVPMEVDGGGSVASATVEITDPKGTQSLAPTGMTDEGANVFSYVWQSLESGVSGFYRADVRPTSGAYTGRSRVKFELEA
jgi:hypothetical protein